MICAQTCLIPFLCGFICNLLFTLDVTGIWISAVHLWCSPVVGYCSSCISQTSRVSPPEPGSSVITYFFPCDLILAMLCVFNHAPRLWLRSGIVLHGLSTVHPTLKCTLKLASSAWFIPICSPQGLMFQLKQETKHWVSQPPLAAKPSNLNRNFQNLFHWHRSTPS